jgi:pimeloyl-ACP methyl ester carboxylesterase
MSSPLVVGETPDVPLHGELRWGWELARLAADPEFVRPGRQVDAPPVLLIPGFMASDQSLSALRGWLRRRGSATAAAGIRLNVDCAERVVSRIEARLRQFQPEHGRRVVVVGQSRGGELGRVLAVRNPDLVSTLVMLGSPVREPLSVGPAVLSAVRSVARLGDLGVPGMFSRQCATGDCCSDFRGDLAAPRSAEVHAVAVYSRSDGIVSWQACLDPCARHIEVDSSHCGMAVNRAVYRSLGEILDQEEDPPWSG